MPIELNKPAIVGGKASVKLTQISETLQGVVDEYSFLPQFRGTYTGKVSEGSTKARISWSQKIDVPSVKLGYPADATMDATIEITNVGGEICGRVVRYNSIPEENEAIEINVKRGNSSARSRSGSYSVELESEPVASGKAIAIVKKKSLPVLAKISKYEVVTEGDLVGAKIPEGPTDIAQPYSGNYEIILDEEHETTRYLKVRIVRVDKFGVFGTVEDTKIDLSSDDEFTGLRNPFKSGNSSKNDLISGKQL